MFTVSPASKERTAVGGFCVPGKLDIQAKDVTYDLAPEGALRSPADDGDVLKVPVEIGENLEAVIEAERHTFEQGPGKVRPGMDHAEAEEVTSGLGIEIGTALTEQVRVENKSSRP